MDIFGNRTIIYLDHRVQLFIDTHLGNVIVTKIRENQKQYNLTLIVKISGYIINPFLRQQPLTRSVN